LNTPTDCKIEARTGVATAPTAAPIKAMMAKAQKMETFRENDSLFAALEIDLKSNAASTPST